MHLRDIPRSRIEELTPLLFDVAEAGDEVARSVVAKQAREIVLLARIAAERLELLDEPHTIVLGGGVLTARRPLLHGPVLAGLATAAPRATIEIVHDRPVAGAALLALDQWGRSRRRPMRRYGLLSPNGSRRSAGSVAAGYSWLRSSHNSG